MSQFLKSVKLCVSRLSSTVHVIHYTEDEHNVVLEKHWGQIKELAYGWILSWERAAAKMLIDRNDWIFVYLTSGFTLPGTAEAITRSGGGDLCWVLGSG